MSNQDMLLKLRIKRILLLQNYWTPLEVQLTAPKEKGSSGRAIFTDLDVLAIKYDTTFVRTVIVCDCKSGEVSDANRLFWLRGVSHYFGADTGIFLKPKIEKYPRQMAPAMGLRTMDETELGLIEKSLNVELLPIPLTDAKFYKTYERHFQHGIAKSAKPTLEQLIRKELISFLNYKYWYVPEHRRLITLVESFSKAAHLLDPSNPQDVFLAHIGLERFCHSILESARFSYSSGLQELPGHVKDFIFGGPSSHRRMTEIAELMQELKMPVELYPEYTNDLIEVVNRAIINPQGASKILPFLELFYLWSILMENGANLESLFKALNRPLETAPIVFAKDASRQFCLFTGLKTALFECLHSL